jgi:hypothetical protein
MSLVDKPERACPPARQCYFCAALLHGAKLSAGSPHPARRSLHSVSVAVGHPEAGHRVEDPARELHLDALASQGTTPHAYGDFVCLYCLRFGYFIGGDSRPGARLQLRTEIRSHAPTPSFVVNLAQVDKATGAAAGMHRLTP